MVCGYKFLLPNSLDESLASFFEIFSLEAKYPKSLLEIDEFR